MHPDKKHHLTTFVLPLIVLVGTIGWLIIHNMR
jgi:hypothetical protein